MTATADPYQRLMRRLPRAVAGLGAIGFVSSFLWAGRVGAASFLAGAALSILSMFLLHQFVRVFGGQRLSTLSLLLIAGRLLLVVGLAYVILKQVAVHTPALAAGILLCLAALTLEALIESSHAS